MNLLKSTIFCTLASTALLAVSAQAELVYDNTTDPTPDRFNIGGIEVGDEIVLGGSGRVLTEFSFQYYGISLSGLEQARLRIYANDGPLVSSESSPGSLLYDSGSFSGLESGDHTLIFDDFGSWDRVVPNSFTWSVQFSNLGAGAEMGVALFDSVTVGSNYPDYWEKNGGNWVIKQGGEPMNFAAQIQAVPEPSTITLGFLGAAAGVYAFRRQRR